MKTVSVVPAAHGWAVRSDAIDNELFFRTGAAAERAARRLAESLSQAGHAAKLSIHLRDGSPVATFLCPPQWAPQAAGSDRQAFIGR